MNILRARFRNFSNHKKQYFRTECPMGKDSLLKNLFHNACKLELDQTQKFRIFPNRQENQNHRKK
uniref:Ovule protein n=1 Tax=Romanomermis culicivorax TaxID=13658 RepID=A0A915KX09_ROMCU